ncbi:hypothetical protein RIF29_10468 [Crotalaria pallida]|uniref:Uncharacterized protein n=1 Tax=Crotalaria pallida TaxID=3830 RepID=A0AAN9IIE1_CROPI
MCRSINYYGHGDEDIDPMALLRSNKLRMNKLNKLEDIPEDKELLVRNSYNDINIDDDDGGGDVIVNQELEEALEIDLEVLRRTFDMGIWVVVCLGLGGYMFSRAKFRPPKFS